MCSNKSAGIGSNRPALASVFNSSRIVQIDLNNDLTVEQLLKRERDFAEGIIQTAQVIVLVLDTEARVLHINPFMEELSGYHLDEVQGKDWFDTFLPPADHKRIRELFKNAISDIQTRGNVNPILTRDGKVRHIQWYDKTLKGTDGQVIGLISIGLDITALKDAQNQLQKARDELEIRVQQRTEQLQATTKKLRDKTCELEAITNHLPDIVIRFDRQFRKVFVNPAIEQYSDRIRDYFLHSTGQPAGFSEELVKFRNSRLEEVFRTGRMDEFDFTLQTSQGLRYFEERVIPECSSVGAIDHVVAIVRDVTGRKLAEQALSESEQRFRLMAESIREVVWLMDWPEGHLIYVSPPYEQIWGKALEQAANGPAGWLEPIHSADRNRLINKIHAMYKDGVDEVFRIYHADGSMRWIHMKSVPVSDQQGIVRRIAGTIEDITRIRLEEEEHRRRQSEYAHIFRLATAGEMADSLAHELNQPFCAIVNLAEAASLRLKAGKHDMQKQVEHLQDISTQAQRAGTIIRRLRELVQKRKPHVTNVKVNDLVRETVALVRHDLDLANISIVLDLDDELPDLQADKIQVQQVLINLVRNAIEALVLSAVYMPKIAIHATLTSSAELEVIVSDNGPGLPVDIREHVFEPYYSTKKEGMGLGLSICRSIIESHRGRIWTDMAARGGAAFHFILPLA